MLSGLSLPVVALLLAAGVLLDFALGEVRRWHPLIGFGNLVYAIERRLNRGGARFWRGALAWLLAVVPLVALTTWTCGALGLAAHAVTLYFCIGLRSLRDHNLPIAKALAGGDLAQARLLTARIVSRDTREANAADLAKASAESLLENGNDAVFGALFWFVLFGAPGAVLFRLANTLDAMWGYRNERFRHFGWAAARLDDALNYLPARLTALTYATGGFTGRALRCWRTQAPRWDSPNAGPVMAAGAGSLGLELGGAAIYHGALESRPRLGEGRPATPSDIGRALALVERGLLAWLLGLLLAALLFALVAAGANHA